MTDKLNWNRLNSRYTEPQLPLFRVRLDAMQHPQSGAIMDRLVLESADWVNVVAVDTRSLTVMVRQYRFGTGAVTLETPGGLVDPGENSEIAARRELLEETGYSGGCWHYLGAVEPNPAIHDHLCHHWLAQGVEQQSAPELGRGEAIELSLLTPDEVKQAVVNGGIRHALALSALARVHSLWPRSFLQK